MEEEEGGGPRLSKRFADKGGEVDYKTKAGTAWSHNFLNQKPWHPLSYPNQRRKWIAEQTHAQKQRRSDEIAREYAQEQEFFRQTALASKKEKEKLEMMKAVSFMYVRPPGYNPESAKAAEVEDERKKQEHVGTSQSLMAEGDLETKKVEPVEEKKKPRPKDVFGRLLPTEEQFEVLKNAPRLDTGAPGRAKPFAVEIRNVKCVRCGTFGHQSGDRECPLKDTIMPNEESRLKRDDPLTAILAQTESAEPLKWELKQKPGLSPPRGGFRPDDPNQQIVAEDIFDEYGGFLAGGDNIPDLLLSNFSRSMTTKKKKKSSNSRHRRRSPDSSDQEETGSSSSSSSSSSSDHRGRRSKKRHRTKKRREPDDESFGKSDRHHQKRSSSGIKSRHCRHSDSAGKYKTNNFHHRRHHHHHRRHRSRSLSE
ncbi:unnamed protein product [Cuscuta campestris]|uniref:CBF1-interacting co-repressor CIR N-terminal domain-containing protein n=1 Tax=Cuscuta campestris TaxID=132261 RepID=A0A484KM82_9ASTE|nr:unnamed protein product [Cuscuta campestris]